MRVSKRDRRTRLTLHICHCTRTDAHTHSTVRSGVHHIESDIESDIGSRRNAQSNHVI